MAFTVAISTKPLPDDVDRSMVKPVSLSELSFQLSSIWVSETAVAVSSEGGSGIASRVVAVAVLELSCRRARLLERSPSRPMGVIPPMMELREQFTLRILAMHPERVNCALTTTVL